MHQYKFASLIALLALFALTAASGLSGTLGSNGYLYKRQSFPVDPSNTEISFTGGWNAGTISLRTNNPNTTCVEWPGRPIICGNRATDNTLLIACDHGVFSLISATNNPGPQSLGNATDVTVFGTWGKDGQINLDVSYFLEIANKAQGVIARVSARTAYFGSVDKHSLRFSGYASAFAIAYINQNPTAYQIVTAFGEIDSDEIKIVLPHRALSPYPTTSQTTPVAPFYVTGKVYNAFLSNGALHGNIDLHTVTNVINIVNGTFISDYIESPSMPKLITISAGLVNDEDGTDYYIENLELALD
jgi:hypothetical protein